MNFWNLYTEYFYQKICKWLEHWLYPNGILLKKLNLNAGSYITKKENFQTQIF